MKNLVALLLLLITIPLVSFADDKFEKVDDKTVKITSTEINNVDINLLIERRDLTQQSINQLNIEHAEKLATLTDILNKYQAQIDAAKAVGVEAAASADAVVVP